MAEATGSHCTGGVSTTGARCGAAADRRGGGGGATDSGVTTGTTPAAMRTTAEATAETQHSGTKWRVQPSPLFFTSHWYGSVAHPILYWGPDRRILASSSPSACSLLPLLSLLCLLRPRGSLHTSRPPGRRARQRARRRPREGAARRGGGVEAAPRRALAVLPAQQSFRFQHQT